MTTTATATMTLHQWATLGRLSSYDPHRILSVEHTPFDLPPGWIAATIQYASGVVTYYGIEPNGQASS